MMVGEAAGRMEQNMWGRGNRRGLVTELVRDRKEEKGQG